MYETLQTGYYRVASEIARAKFKDIRPYNIVATMANGKFLITFNDRI